MPDQRPPSDEQPPDAVDPVQTHEIAGRTYVVADVEPLDVDGTLTVAVGTALFAVAFVLSLAFHTRLEHAGRGWWTWAALAGVGLGAIGWGYCRRRRSRRRAREAARAH